MSQSILKLLEGEDRRSIGRADRAAAMVAQDAELFPELIAGLWSGDALVRMRAADAAEKATRGNREVLQPYKRELLELMAETGEQELRWHLAAMIPRLRLNARERQLAASSVAPNGLNRAARGSERIYPQNSVTFCLSLGLLRQRKPGTIVFDSQED